ncbi:hypothetical protein B0H17DRAFT_1232727, partial [Mycena rosella]
MPHSETHCCTNCGFITSDDETPPAPPLSGSHPLLLTNHPPAGSEFPEIIDFLANGKQHLDLLNTRISVIAATMDSLVIDRDAIAEHVRSHTAAISLLRQLPTEILRRILSMSRRPSSRLKPPEVPWYLGHISKRWREVAVALPSLW